MASRLAKDLAQVAWASRTSSRTDRLLLSLAFRDRSFCTTQGHDGKDRDVSLAGVFASLREASSKSREVVELNLANSDDMTCLNVMCAKLGDPCLCRVSVVLSKLKNLQKLDISGNGLTELPTEALVDLRSLRIINIAGNPLQTFPEALGSIPNLEEVAMDAALRQRYAKEWIRMQHDNPGVRFSIVEV